MRPCQEDHDELMPEKCRLCWLFVNDAAYKNKWNTGENKDISSLPCKHRGPLIPLSERYKFSLGTLRDWFTCAKGFGSAGPKYEFCSPCQGCNDKCHGYEKPSTGD